MNNMRNSRCALQKFANCVCMDFLVDIKLQETGTIFDVFSMPIAMEIP